jgi:hypothetical protein
MCADVAGFVLAYHDSPQRCCLWIEVMPTETEFPLFTAYMVADLLYKQNILLLAHRKEAGSF